MGGIQREPGTAVLQHDPRAPRYDPRPEVGRQAVDQRDGVSFGVRGADEHRVPGGRAPRKRCRDGALGRDERPTLVSVFSREHARHGHGSVFGVGYVASRIRHGQFDGLHLQMERF